MFLTPLRRKLLERGRTLALQQLREIACAMEHSEKQASSIEGATKKVNSVDVKAIEKGNVRAGKQGRDSLF